MAKLYSSDGEFFVQRDEYIESFFRDVKSQLAEAKVGKDERSAQYKDLELAAKWSNDLWCIQLINRDTEPIQRQYDPANARSTQSAADYFVDALRRANGEEIAPRVSVTMRNYRGRPSNK